MKLGDRTTQTLVIVGAIAGAVWYVTRKAPAIAQAVNPTNPNNVFYGAANAAVEGVTGDRNQTLGGAIFDFFNPDAAGQMIYRRSDYVRTPPIRPADGDIIGDFLQG